MDDEQVYIKRHEAGDHSGAPDRRCDHCRDELDDADERRRKRRDSQEIPDFAGSTSTLTEMLAAPDLELSYAIDDIALSDSLVSLPSSRKTGKSTYLANKNQSAVDGIPFLDRFDCHLEGNIAIINAEMSAAGYRKMYEQLGVKNTDRIRVLNCREKGLKVDLMNDAVAEEMVRWLTGNEAEWWDLDPWKDFLRWSGTKMNDNDGVNNLVGRARDIHQEAGIKLTTIPMHTTQAPQEEGGERGKGAGEFEDSIDAMWRYTRAKGTGRVPRVLSVEGRTGVGLDEVEIIFDETTGRLSLGTRNRQDMKAEQEAQKNARNRTPALLDKVLGIIKAHAKAQSPLKRSEVRDKTGGSANDIKWAVDELVDRKHVEVRREKHGADKQNCQYVYPAGH